MVFNATFNNISVISRWSFLLHGGGNRDTRKNHRPVEVTDKMLSHNVVLTTSRLSGIRTHNLSGDRHRLHRYIVINPTTIRSRPRRPLLHTISFQNTGVNYEDEKLNLFNPIHILYSQWLGELR